MDHGKHEKHGNSLSEGEGLWIRFFGEVRVRARGARLTASALRREHASVFSVFSVAKLDARRATEVARQDMIWGAG
jgi:hypothetical protein